MGRGKEWSYVSELVQGKTVSHLQCKSCGHQYHGNATRIKEHLFSIGTNVTGCPTPPGDIWVHFAGYAKKCKDQGLQSKRMRGMNSTLPTDHSNTYGPGVDEAYSQAEATQTASAQTPQNLYGHRPSSSGLVDKSPATSSHVNPQSTLHTAFEKQDMLELHLKWTQAFLACGIPFNVIRNPIFKDALMSTAKKGFVMPDYNKMRTEYVDKVKNSTEAVLKRTVLDFVPMYGCTIALDGWTSCQKKPLINVMLICPKGSMFLEAIDTSLKEKTSNYLTKVYEHAISRAGGPKNVTAIVTDNASNFKSAGLAIQEKYSSITWVPCAAHTLNLLLKDIGKMSFITQTLLDANHIVKFIREHQFSYALFRSKSPNKALHIFCATCFATAFIVLTGLIDVKAALTETVADRRWDAWIAKYPSYRVAADKCVSLIQSQSFWRNVDKVVGVSKPFVELLRVVDSEKFVIGKVYWIMSEAIRQVKEFNLFSTREKGQLAAIAERRWAQMHTHLHGAAFILDPRFQMHGQASNREVMTDFKKTCQQLLPGPEGRDAFHQRVDYANREGCFGDPWHIEAMRKCSAPVWWKEYGGEKVELQYVAMRVLSVAASSGSCERNWSAYDFLHSKRRNRLSPARANDLVYVFCNMRLIHVPTNIATKAVHDHFGTFQTHEAATQETWSDDEVEWEMASECSDLEEVDNMVPVLNDESESL